MELPARSIRASTQRVYRIRVLPSGAANLRKLGSGHPARGRVRSETKTRV
jgi:hypothetical protein